MDQVREVGLTLYSLIIIYMQTLTIIRWPSSKRGKCFRPFRINKIVTVFELNEVINKNVKKPHPNILKIFYMEFLTADISI